MTDREWMEGEQWTPEQIKEIKKLGEANEKDSKDASQEKTRPRQ